MKLDLFYEIDVPRPWAGEHPYGQRTGEQESYREALEQIRLADRLGFNTVWLVEHHFREGRSHCSSPEVVHGALSQITENLRLGFGVTLMPHGFTHPARVAEKVATVDVLSGGRVEWGTGRSTPMEQLAFGVDRETSRDSAEDAIRSVVHMWEAEYAEWDSEWLSFPKRLVAPKPVQDPHPPAWMAAVSDGSAEIAGRQGLGLMSLAIMQPLTRMEKQIAGYRKAAANPEPITRVVNNRVAAYTLVNVMDDPERDADDNRVWESCWWWYQNLAEFTLEWEFPHFTQEQKDAYFPFLKRNADGNFDPKEFNKQDMIIVGDVDTCLEKILHYDRIGVDQLLCYVQFGYLPHQSVMRTIELLGTEVIPELERRGHRVEATAQAGVTR
jgi:alkanesulfonate monooxygenase SsuD/methylene tetrahydromethanopterin reductase-like flavin-dependent oxidoreductase (luciferase family)